MRGRAWRRYKEETKVVKRLKGVSHYWRYRDANGNLIQHYQWINLIGTSQHFMFKTYVTSKGDSKYKNKWGRRPKKAWWDEFNRTSDKKSFRKMLEVDYGIKHMNIEYESIRNYTET